jgi:hypothetical protein
VTVFQCARLLRGESLDFLASKIGVRKSWLSVITRMPRRFVGLKLRERLCAHYGGVPWEVLTTEIDGNALATSLLANLSAKKGVSTHV